MKLCVIPARGGSKRIPRKNIRDFCGQPIIAWSIQTALASECFDRVVVSTDDSQIADVALQYGADCPFTRPKELSGDHIGTLPVISHAINWHIENFQAPSKVCCIYATAPFVRADDIRLGLNMLSENLTDYVVPVTTYAYPIERALRISSMNRLAMFEPSNANIRSQDLTEAWHDAGQFYWGHAKSWLDGKSLLDCGSLPLPLPRYRVQDIDSLEDWTRAELMFRMLHEG